MQSVRLTCNDDAAEKVELTLHLQAHSKLSHKFAFLHQTSERLNGKFGTAISK